MNESHQHRNVSKWSRDDNSYYRPPLLSYDNNLDAWLNIMRSPSDIGLASSCCYTGDVIPKCHTLIVYLFYSN